MEHSSSFMSLYHFIERVPVSGGHPISRGRRGEKKKEKKIQGAKNRHSYVLRISGNGIHVALQQPGSKTKNKLKKCEDSFSNIEQRLKRSLPQICANIMSRGINLHIFNEAWKRIFHYKSDLFDPSVAGNCRLECVVDLILSNHWCHSSTGKMQRAAVKCSVYKECRFHKIFRPWEVRRVAGPAYMEMHRKPMQAQLTGNEMIQNRFFMCKCNYLSSHILRCSQGCPVHQKLIKADIQNQ